MVARIHALTNQPMTTATKRRSRSIPGYLSHHPDGVQARVTRRGQNFTKWFSDSLNKGRRGAVREARQWLAQLAPTLPSARPPLRKPLSGKTTDYPAGVSLTRSRDRRRNGVTLRFSVHYVTGGRRRTASFNIGDESLVTPADIEAVAKVAIAFRECYVKAIEEGRRFKPLPWRNWRKSFTVELQWSHGRTSLDEEALARLIEKTNAA